MTLVQLGAVSVARGATVAEGEVVGEVGESEDAVTTAPHVHLGIRVASEPNGYVDPGPCCRCDPAGRARACAGPDAAGCARPAPPRIPPVWRAGAGVIAGAGTAVAHGRRAATGRGAERSDGRRPAGESAHPCRLRRSVQHGRPRPPPRLRPCEASGVRAAPHGDASRRRASGQMRSRLSCVGPSPRRGPLRWHGVRPAARPTRVSLPHRQHVRIGAPAIGLGSTAPSRPPLRSRATRSGRSR